VGVCDSGALVLTGTPARHVAKTKMNDTSSRSHLIVSMVITSEGLGDRKGKNTIGKLSLVDLAGYACGPAPNDSDNVFSCIFMRVVGMSRPSSDGLSLLVL
jgi:hypothetical protein